MTTDRKVERLAGVPIFAHADRAHLTHLASVADEVDIRSGMVIARQGERGMDFFVIESGTASVTRDGEQIAELGPGDFFGEMSLVDNSPRNATVTAATDMSIVIVRKPAFDAVQEDVPGLREAIARAVAERRATAPELE
jgi:CRP/FNR family transcriptional regulator, cyclic AMP receptor protein